MGRGGQHDRIVKPIQITKTKVKSLNKVPFLLIAILFLVLLGGGCKKEELYSKPCEEINPPYESGTKLSYTVKESSISRQASKGGELTIGGLGLNTSLSEVEIYFDASKKNYQFRTRLINTNRAHFENFSNPEIVEVVTTNSYSTFYDKNNRVISTIENTSKRNNSFSHLVTPYQERTKHIKEMLVDIASSKSGDYAVETQADTAVVKITKLLTGIDELDENTVGFTAVSYVNMTYGVPVLSELYDRDMRLVSKTIILYKLINNIPVAAYEEAISYTQNQDGEWIEHKTIHNYDNIKISNF